MVSLEECAYQHGLLMLLSREFHSQIKSSLLIPHSVMNVITDLMILCLPIRFVVRLQMKTARKLQVLGAFGLGGM
jgi:hypothetical protein